ncbi:GNAT family N-acetyltransferase [Bacillus sp. T33-2]|uniref:GNAT family N-acetyltransferase n=1 Tax=Bacillus sp. T33-2 TaxID=2054168 RepID=UPI000C78714C|nr:GNAT family N-acetyltransferase [Bacillus sp. T33-2]PLR95507.1 N-acetyltransferase [Bacillus sp. T33-2]
MEEIINQLKNVGVHIIKNDWDILLEVHNDKLIQSSKMDVLIMELISKMKNYGIERISLECPKTLLDKLISTKQKMRIVGERVIFIKDFSEQREIFIPSYEVWSITDTKSLLFLSEVMGNEANKAEKFLMSMKSELPTQAEKMYTVYTLNNEPIGVVFPHIEPETNKEGRIFWIGIHPKFIGKGYGKNLHLIGLYRLQNEFKAKSYLGATKIENIPMRRIMKTNGCSEQKDALITLVFSS